MSAARIAARWPLPIFGIPTLRDRLTLFPVALPNTPCPVIAESKMRYIERRHGNADQIAAFPADHLAVRNVLPQILADLAADNLSKAALIALDFHDHGRSRGL